MARARLMDTIEDFKKLGINPDKVEMWEDGIRNDDESGKMKCGISMQTLMTAVKL